MARQKNRGYQEFSPLYSTPTRTVRRWNMGGYIRLSREDLKRGSDDSNSVKNQRDLLRDFYQKHIPPLPATAVAIPLRMTTPIPPAIRRATGSWTRSLP